MLKGALTVNLFAQMHHVNISIILYDMHLSLSLPLTCDIRYQSIRRTMTNERSEEQPVDPPEDTDLLPHNISGTLLSLAPKL